MYFIDPVKNTRALDLWAGDLLPRECKTPSGDPACFVIGGHHSMIDDHDYLELSAIHLNNNFGMVARVSVASPHKQMWRLTRLDFSEAPNNGACTLTCDDKGPPSYGCSLQLVHEVIVVDEDTREQWVDLLIPA